MPPDPVLDDFADEVGASGPVAVAGARTRWDLGGALDPDARVVRAPEGIVAHEPAEMTVRVRAGTSVAELDAALAEADQRCALPDRGGTVGGALAVGEDDVRVLGVGRVRAALLQVRYVSAEGRVITGGGPTVKNVSGFDLPRLMVGSLGTLGLVGEALLRTNPIPAEAAWLEADDADPFAVFAALYAPSSVLWDGQRTWVNLEGHGPDVADQVGVLEGHGSFTRVSGPPALPPHRWNLAPADLLDLDAEAVGEHVAVVGVGTVHASRPQPAGPGDPALAALAGRVKAEFDPTGRLNPGRDPAVR